MCALVYPPGLLVYLSYSLIIVAFEGSGRYIDAAVVTAVAMLVRVYLLVLPGSKEVRLFEGWAAGNEIDPMTALGATFTYTRRLMPERSRPMRFGPLCSGSLSVGSPGRPDGGWSSTGFSVPRTARPSG